MFSNFIYNIDNNVINIIMVYFIFTFILLFFLFKCIQQAEDFDTFDIIMIVSGVICFLLIDALFCKNKVNMYKAKEVYEQTKLLDD